MRTLLLAGTSLLALSASLATASAYSLTNPFNYTGSIVPFTVPVTGIYDIVAIGGQGGTEPYFLSSDNATGGYGARVEGYFTLTQNEVLSIAVGGQGGNGPGFDDYAAGGGGGGSFVIGPGNNPLLVAGGGGGGGVYGKADGVSATSLPATAGTGALGGFPGFNGYGGAGGSNGGSNYSGGGGGGGFRGGGGFGGLDVNNSFATGGASFADGLAGGTGDDDNSLLCDSSGGAGGFGGGGGGGCGIHTLNHNVGSEGGGGGGGGGGYNGGGGGSAHRGYGGGAGGSFNAGKFQTFSTATGGGSGYVGISYYGSPCGDDCASRRAVPEPASLALFGTGLAGLGLIRKRRRR